MIWHFLVFGLIAMGVSFLLTPLTSWIAKKAKIYDIPSERKIHKKPVPLLGGVPIFIAFNLSVILGILLNKSFVREALLSQWRELLICQAIILALGLIDDIMNLNPLVKLVIQVFAGALIVFFGFGVSLISNPFGGDPVNLGIFSIPLTILWLVGITNALNLIDGLDGLAAGTSIIAGATIFVISIMTGNPGIAFVSLCLSASLIGFLRYNFAPAKIFLGDSGSLLLGFLLAVISIQGSSKGAVLVTVLAPVLVLGLPIMETLLSMIRRFLRSIHLVDYPTRNGRFRALFFKRITIFEADTDHIHHRLLKFGFSQRKAVIILYSICVALSGLALLSVAFRNINAVSLLAAILIAFYIGIRRLKYQEFKVLQNGLLIPLFHFPSVDRNHFQAFIDLLVIAFSYLVSFLLVFKTLGPSSSLFIRSLPLVLLIKIVIFYFSSIYRGSWTYSSIEDALTILKATLFSSGAVIVVFSFLFGLDAFGGLTLFVLDFYLTLTFVAGFRVSYRVFHSLYRQGLANNGRKVLIYGAGYRGSTVLKEIRNNDAYALSPAGFIDDSLEKTGKKMHGVPILGTIEDLEKILERYDISEIIVSTAKIGREKIRRLTEFCREKGIVVRQFEFRFYEFP